MVAEYPRRKKVKKSRARLSITEAAKIKRRLLGTLNGQASPFGFVCSDPWARVCVATIESGRIQLRKKQRGLERDLFNAGIYPPAGAATSMVENDKMVWVPPDITGTPLDQREDNLTVVQGCRLPRSVSALAIEKIRLLKARPVKTRVRQTRR